jgi:hypothetical protein
MSESTLTHKGDVELEALGFKEKVIRNSYLSNLISTGAPCLEETKKKASLTERVLMFL